MITEDQFEKLAIEWFQQSGWRFGERNLARNSATHLCPSFLSSELSVPEVAEMVG